MSEYLILYLVFGSLIGVAVAALLYMLGGRAGKWKRRYVGSFVLAGTVNVVSVVMQIWNPWLLLVFPALIGGFSMGYGGDNLGMKILRRTLYAAGVCAAGLVFCLTMGGNAWWVLIPHVGVGAWSIYLGVKNPIYAAAEEGFICVLLNIGLCMYPFIVR